MASPPCVIHTPAELATLDLAALAERPEPARVLMCTPDFFTVLDVKNAFMADNVGAVDPLRARAQWEDLRRAFVNAGHEVCTLPGVADLEDMVFAANQVLPGVRADGSRYVVLARMRHPSRRREVPHYRAWFAAQGYTILELPPSVEWFEGQGDALFYPGRQLVFGGYGQRTSRAAYEELAKLLAIPVIAVALTHPKFYHLDTALCVLSPDAALMYPGAFDETGQQLIRRLFPRIIEVPEHEALQNFACNAHALDGRTVILQQGATQTVRSLRDAGFSVVEVDTSEFMKSGGSVFCMKMMVY